MSASIPATVAINQPLAVEWNIETGLSAPEDLPAGAVMARAGIKVSGAQSTAITTVSAAASSAVGKGQPLLSPSVPPPRAALPPAPVPRRPGRLPRRRP